LTTIFAPSVAIAKAWLLPRPLPEPVIIATLPSSMPLPFAILVLNLLLSSQDTLFCIWLQKRLFFNYS
jgi:hypothetical protein